MANGTYYAYSTFNTEVDEWGRVQKSIKPGDEVSQSDLAVDDETWQGFIDSGVVSTVPHPETQPGESPNEAFAREDAALAAGTLSEEEAAKVEERQEAQKEASYNVMTEATKLATAGEDEAAANLIEEKLGNDEEENENPNTPAGASEPQPTQLPANPTETGSASRDYESMTVEQLKTLAGKREIEGRGTMNKDALVAALQESDKQAS